MCNINIRTSSEIRFSDFPRHYPKLAERIPFIIISTEEKKFCVWFVNGALNEFSIWSSALAQFQSTT